MRSAVLDEAIVGTEEAIQEGRFAIRDLRPEPSLRSATFRSC